mmetsp:Transcript_76402/g.151137  ORF Transcript_76402/g.151137 Transcript_76402/m.151137 type:complete len:179 (-) Transcript_76402:23-559(-)
MQKPLLLPHLAPSGRNYGDSGKCWSKLWLAAPCTLVLVLMIVIFVGLRPKSTLQPSTAVSLRGNGQHVEGIRHVGDNISTLPASPCTGLRKMDCRLSGSCAWHWTGNWRTSCMDANSCESLNKMDCMMQFGQCKWKWSGNWHTSCVGHCVGFNKLDCQFEMGCQWKWNGNWRTSCITA